MGGFRNGGGGARGDRGGAVGREGGAAAARGEGRLGIGADASNAAVPGGSRPSYGNPTIGAAVPRGSLTPPGGGSDGINDGGSYTWYGYGDSRWSYGYRYPYGPYGSYYDGFLYYPYPYDPFPLYGYGAFGLGSFYFYGGYGGYGAFSSGYYGDFSSGYGGGYGSSSSSDRSAPSTGPKGGLKLKVSPVDAEVYVDGYYIGRVDDYNGAFQRLDLTAGVHRVELRAKGYQQVSFEVAIEPRDTVAYHGAMQRAAPIK
jgi:hypothetical protein